MGRPTFDPLGRDEETLGQSEVFDEDNMGVDPLERGMDPAEGWAGSDRYGTTATEQVTDRPLTDRLDEERPDVGIELVPDRPVAATPVEDLDESIDNEVMYQEPVPGEEGVLVGSESDNTGESVTRRAGDLVTEPDQPAADETAMSRPE